MRGATHHRGAPADRRPCGWSGTHDLAAAPATARAAEPGPRRSRSRPGGHPGRRFDMASRRGQASSSRPEGGNRDALDCLHASLASWPPAAAAPSRTRPATKAASVAAGQWELTSRGHRLRRPTRARRRSTRRSAPGRPRAVCVDASRPPTAMFSGDGYDCRYDSYYARNGRVNATMICSRAGQPGNIPMTADGQFTADTIEYTRAAPACRATATSRSPRA